MKVKFEVEFTLPDGGTPDDAKSYVFAAIRVFKEYMDPKMAMFYLDRKTVKVRKVKNERTGRRGD